VQILDDQATAALARKIGAITMRDAIAATRWACCEALIEGTLHKAAQEITPRSKWIDNILLRR
jgi:hypothetical protein